MAVKATLPTSFGEDRDLYIRLNNLEDAQNHGRPPPARYRGYLSEAAYRSGASFVWEDVIGFDADVSQPLWDQAYSALKNISDLPAPTPPDPIPALVQPAAPTVSDAPDPPPLAPNADAKAKALHAAELVAAAAKRQTLADVYAKDSAARAAAHAAKMAEYDQAVVDHAAEVARVDKLNAQAAALRGAKDV
jgi:hypothetical protein